VTDEVHADVLVDEFFWRWGSENIFQLFITVDYIYLYIFLKCATVKGHPKMSMRRPLSHCDAPTVYMYALVYMIYVYECPREGHPCRTAETTQLNEAAAGRSHWFLVYDRPQADRIGL
jgi:hypothetical protein